jgi:hypothetical protein
MSQTIIVENDEENRKRLAINLNAYIGTNVIEHDDAGSVLNLLSILPEVDLIITREKINGESTAEKIINYVDGRELLIPVIVLGEMESDYNFISTLADPKNWQQVVKTSAKHLGVTPEQMAERITPEFFAVPTYYFQYVDKTVTDLFMKVINDEQKVHYVKKLWEGDFVEKEFLDDLHSKGLQYLHTNDEDLHILVNFISSRLSEMMDDDEMTLQRRVMMASHAFEVVGHQVRNIGLQGATVQLGQAISDSLVYSVNQIPHFDDLLAVYDEQPCSYAFKLFHMASMFSYDVIRRMEWGTQDHHERLTFASLFGNVTLTSDEWCRIRSEQDLQKIEANEQLKKRIMYHAMRASQIIKDSNELPPGSELIVKYHHGSAEGVGFPSVVKDTFSPLANIYTVSEDLANFVLDQRPSTEEVKKFLAGLKNKFTHVAFADVINKFIDKFSE